jgi:hypothetical protein
MDIIPIQASSVPCERVFSSGKETMAPRRRHIKAELMEKLQMLKYAIWKDAQLNFTEGLAWKEELIEIEALQKDAIPTDMYSYIKSLDVTEDDGDEDWEDEEEEEEEEDEEEEDIYG